MRLRTARAAVAHISHLYRATNLKPLYADHPAGRHIGWTFHIVGRDYAWGWVLIDGRACHGPVLGGRDSAAAEGRLNAT